MIKESEMKSPEWLPLFDSPGQSGSNLSALHLNTQIHRGLGASVLQ